MRRKRIFIYSTLKVFKDRKQDAFCIYQSNYQASASVLNFCVSVSNFAKLIDFKQLHDKFHKYFVQHIH